MSAEAMSTASYVGPVVRIDNGSQNPHTGMVSRHSSLDLAEIIVKRENQQLRKLPGYATAWHPYEIQHAVTSTDGSVDWVKV